METESHLVNIKKERERTVPHSNPTENCSNRRCNGCWEQSERIRQGMEEAWQAWVKSWEGHGGWPH